MKIEIRHVEPGDYPALQQVFLQPKAMQGTLQMPFPSLELWKKRLSEESDNFYHLAACVEGEIVGSLGLTIEPQPRRRHVGGLGMGVHDDWPGKGVGTALMQAAVDLADQWLNLARLELTVYTDNVPAIKLYQNFGFKIEGTFEKYAFREGKYVDAHSMARVQEEV